ncbi:MAG: V-type ATP synthase subunit E family protein [Sulfolobales archaeon]|nr:V-type ATP synthase subunit E family protein [Sulfolobales archaeon]MCX8208701.1 V-type ATP synthase subunit E family protein [Sulfolobales archaeon]MDW8010952.1 V-type ATP synthase subunit E family protein [Sulfolobales archaeon]
MSSLESLREAVLRKAREESDRILLSAQESARKIIEEAREKKRALIESEKRRIVSELNYEARIAETKLSARVLISRAKYELLSRVIGRAMDILKELPPELRERSLRTLLEEAIREARSSLGELSKLVVYVSEKDLELVRSIAGDVSLLYGVELEVRTAGISGGVIVEDPDGKVRVDNSYDSRSTVLLSRLSKSLVEEIGL